MPRKLDAQFRDDGSAVYVTQAGDVVDHIAWRHYGTEFGTTEMLLDTNPALPESGLSLPAGIEIILPPVKAKPQEVARRKLWD